MSGKDGTTASAILREWLVSNGYQGLVNPDAGCGCDADDLNPCGWPSNLDGCVCAYKGVDEDGEDMFFTSESDAAASKAWNGEVFDD